MKTFPLTVGLTCLLCIPGFVFGAPPLAFFMKYKINEVSSCKFLPGSCKQGVQQNITVAYLNLFWEKASSCCLICHFTQADLCILLRKNN